MPTPTHNEERRLPLAQARAIAEEVEFILQPTVVRGQIGGSIRRGKPDVGDAEYIFEPKFGVKETGLFGDPERVNLQLELVLSLIDQGVFSKRIHKDGSSTCGAGAQYLWYKNFKIDLFGVIAPSQFGVILAIRTGPEPWSHHQLVKTRLNGGLLQTGQKIEHGQLWDLGKALVTPDEETLFKQIGQPFIAPADRRFP